MKKQKPSNPCNCRERKSLFIQLGIKLYSNKFNEKITIKNNVNKLKIDSNKKPVLNTG